MTPCPLCQRPIDTQARLTGDGVLCACGAILRVQHQANGHTRLEAQGTLPTPAPPTWIIKVTDANGTVFYRRAANRYTRKIEEAHHYTSISVARAKAAPATVWGGVEVIEVTPDDEQEVRR